MAEPLSPENWFGPAARDRVHEVIAKRLAQHDAIWDLALGRREMPHGSDEYRDGWEACQDAMLAILRGES